MSAETAMHPKTAPVSEWHHPGEVGVLPRSKLKTCKPDSRKDD